MRDWFNRTGWRDLIIATPYAWLIVFFLIPFLIVVVMSLGDHEVRFPALRLS